MGLQEQGSPLNATLQAALAKWNGLLPPGFALAVAGHIHIWEALSFQDRRSPQFVLGNGGTMLTHAIKGRSTAGKSAGGRWAPADRRQMGLHDLHAAERGGWTATYYTTKGNDKFSCAVTADGGVVPVI